ncbi:MAG: phosphoenolpyruvate--protein phosphotransferase [Pseudomonadota bacterium]
MTYDGGRTPHGESGITVLLRRMRDAVAREANAQERLDDLTRIIATHVVADVCSIYLRRADDVLELYSTEGLNRDAIHAIQMQWGEGLVGAVAKSRAPLVTDAAQDHPAFKYFPNIGEDPLQSFMGVPLIRSGRVLGVLVVPNRARRQYTPEEIEAVLAVATLLAETTASGELLDAADTEVVDEMLHQPVRFRGGAMAPGIAIGKAVFREAPAPKHLVFARDAATETARLEEGLDRLRKSVDAMVSDDFLAGETREILEAYRLFAYDRGWKERLRAAVMSGLTAEAAVERVQAENRARLANARDRYLRERIDDLDDLSNRLLRCLAGETLDAPRDLPDDAIILARFMGPAELLEYDRLKLKGVVLADGSDTSHVAVVARALDVPVVAGVAEAIEQAEEGEEIIVDGEEGLIHIRPTAEVLRGYAEKRDLRSERQAAYAREADLPTVTRDGVEVEAFMNAGLAIDMQNLAATGAAGVGLFRTELQFLIGRGLPKASEQEKFYGEILELAGGKPVVFRTADLGSDKSAAYMKPREEANPAMGWRGVRMAVDRPGYLRPQLRALIAASAGSTLRVMAPMVTLASEVEAVRALFDQEMQYARDRGKPLPSAVEIGAMVETPAAVWRLEEIAARVDFMSIGGNDLAQFYFAADRETALTQTRFDPLEAGFVSFLKLSVDKAKAVGAPLSYCGEQAADPLFAAALLGVGMRRLSISATAVGPFRRLVRTLNTAELGAWMDDALANTVGSLRPGLDKFLRSKGVDY